MAISTPDEVCESKLSSSSMVLSWHLLFFELVLNIVGHFGSVVWMMWSWSIVVLSDHFGFSNVMANENSTESHESNSEEGSLE